MQWNRQRGIVTDTGRRRTACFARHLATCAMSQADVHGRDLSRQDGRSRSQGSLAGGLVLTPTEGTDDLGLAIFKP